MATVVLALVWLFAVAWGAGLAARASRSKPTLAGPLPKRTFLVLSPSACRFAPVLVLALVFLVSWLGCWCVLVLSEL